MCDVDYAFMGICSLCACGPQQVPIVRGDPLVDASAQHQPAKLCVNFLQISADVRKF